MPMLPDHYAKTFKYKKKKKENTKKNPYKTKQNEKQTKKSPEKPQVYFLLQKQDHD